MQEAKSVNEFLDSIHESYSDNRVIIMLFGRYGIPMVDDLLNRNFDYLDLNSGYTIDIHMPGYGKYKYEEEHLNEGDVLIELDNNRLGWFFNYNKFIEFKKTMKTTCDWKYRDHMQMLIFNYRFGKIDFSNFIDIDFEKALSKGCFTTEREIIEAIINQVENGVTDIVSLSDGLAKEYSEEIVIDFIFSKILFGIGDAGKQIAPYSTKRR